MRKAIIVWGGWQGHEPEECAGIVGEMLAQDGFTTEVTNDLGIFCSPAVADADLLVPIITGEMLEKPTLKRSSKPSVAVLASAGITARSRPRSRRARHSAMSQVSPG
jgi:type 1 glutamine amidotransferase